MELKNKSSGLFTAIFLLVLGTAKAQLNPLASQYYDNPFLASVAMAGSSGALQLNVASRGQLSSIAGKPINTSFTLDYGFNKIGFGVNYYNDQAGLLSRSKLTASYAYRIALDEIDSKLHFGISFGFQKENLNNNAIQGSTSDVTAFQYNSREIIMNGDFGLAFTNEKLNIEFSLFNLNKQTMIENQNSADYATFYTAVSYLFKNFEWQVKPKLVYRGVRNYKDLFDIAIHVKPQYQPIALLGIYHSYNSFSLGLNYQSRRNWQLLGVYNTATTSIRNYANGTFEIGLQFDFTKQGFY